jgi:hypothetical protein
MIRAHRVVLLNTLAVALALEWTTTTQAVSFTESYLDGGSWRTIYAQGFKAGAAPNPNPGHAIGDTVHLDRFQFFKSGTPDTAANIQLAIVNNYFVNLDTLTVNSVEFVGLSTNTIASTAGIATGDPITFEFDSLPLLYGADTPEELLNNNYAAIFVNVGGGGELTPVLVSALGVDYLPAQNEIESDYGSVGNYFLSTSNFTTTNEFGTFLNTFNQTDSGRYGDSNFIASFDLPDGLDGDYNDNTVVDAADYVVWRENLDQPVTLPNDTTPGSVTQADYVVWAANFGAGTGGGALAVSVVPEPVGILLAAIAGAALTCSRRQPLRR